MAVTPSEDVLYASGIAGVANTAAFAAAFKTVAFASLSEPR